jgi:hypothetical protein
MCLDFVVFKMELGCDYVKISRGELLRLEVERNFVKKPKAVWVGVGATASLPGFDARDECKVASYSAKWMGYLSNKPPCQARLFACRELDAPSCPRPLPNP